MSDNPTEDVGYDSEGNPVLNPRIREQLRTQEKQLTEMKKQLRDSELKAVFAELGLPTTGAAKLFRDTYSGEPTLEAVRTAASEYDVLPKPASGQPTAEEDRQRQAELDALRRVNGATDPTNSQDATDVMQSVIKRLKAAKSVEEFDEIMASPEVRSLATQPITFS